jgi:hypothetical protein
MALPKWMQQNAAADAHTAEMQRFNSDPANRTSYTAEEWQAKLDAEMPAAGYQKTHTGWSPRGDADHA